MSTYPPNDLLPQFTRALSQARATTTAQILLPCEDLGATLNFFVDSLGFVVQAIFPADDPRSAIISGFGLQLRLVRGTQPPGVDTIELLCAQVPQDGPREWIAPNGTRVRLVSANPALVIPPTQSSLSISRCDTGAHWHVGRAGLRYRDLIADRHGGAFIASHIRLFEGGPVADYVHFHNVRFQTIYCRKGWVRVVYEDQGEPFVMQAGDCVLQPPQIRHRVLESSAGAEVVEITAPAEHITQADLDMVLPNGIGQPEREYGGQHFMRHVAASAAWAPWRLQGFEYRDTGIAKATHGLAGVRVVRLVGDASTSMQRHTGEFCFYFVLASHLEMEINGIHHVLEVDASISIPSGVEHRLLRAGKALEFLEVTLPANLTYAPR